MQRLKLFAYSVLSIGTLVLTLCFAAPSLAITVQDVPNPRQMNGSWVTDMAEILSPETETKLNQMISQLEAKNGAEMAVVTVPETAPAASPKAFATDLFNTWGIGKQGQDNGVLFLISKGDHRVEIETGYGTEKILPNNRVTQIIDTQIIPRFKQNDFEGGAIAGTQAVIAALEQRNPGTSLGFLLAIGVLLSLPIGLLLWTLFPISQSAPGRSSRSGLHSRQQSSISRNWLYRYARDQSRSHSSSNSSGGGSGGGDSGGGGSW